MIFNASHCWFCGKPLGKDPNNLIIFDFIEFLDPAPPEFERVGDTVVHASCLSLWDRRDEFIEVWNRALKEYFAGKQLYVDAAGNVRYTPASKWLISPSKRVQERQENAMRLHKADLEAQRKALEERMNQARQHAVSIGLADTANVDKTLRDLSAEAFSKEFGRFQISRAYFKKS
jgi:hypothetical protein